MKDPKTVSVICNVKNALPNSTNNNAFFMIDWNSILEPNTPYYVSFTWQGGLNVYDGSRPAMVRANFNQLCFRPIASNFNMSYSNVLGVLEPLVMRPNGSNVHLTATTDTNKPVYIENRPTNTIFNVQVTRSEFSLWTDNATTPAVPADWIMILHFRKAEKKILQYALVSDFGGTGSNRFYSFNTMFDKGKEYRVSFSFVGTKPVAGNNGQPILVFIDFNNEAYIPSSTSFTTSKSGYIGNLSRIRFDVSIDSCYLASNQLTNEPVNTIVNYQGRIFLRFVNLDLTLTTFLQNPWILLLSFEEV